MLHKNQYDFIWDKMARNTFYHLYLRTKWTSWKAQHYKQRLGSHNSPIPFIRVGGVGENPTKGPSILCVCVCVCVYLEDNNKWTTHYRICGLGMYKILFYVHTWEKTSLSIYYNPSSSWGSIHTLILNLKYLQDWACLHFRGENTEAWKAIQLAECTVTPALHTDFLEWPHLPWAHYCSPHCHKHWKRANPRRGL